MSSNEFWAIPKDLFGRGLSQGAILVYGVLFTRKNGDNIAWPSQTYIAEMLGVAPRTVRKHVAELVDASLLETKRRGFGKSNVYTLLPLSPIEDALSKDQTGRSKGSKQDGPIEEKKEESTKVDDKAISGQRIKSAVAWATTLLTASGYPLFPSNTDYAMAAAFLNKYGPDDYVELINFQVLHPKGKDRLSRLDAVTLRALLSNHAYHAWQQSKHVDEDMYE